MRALNPALSIIVPMLNEIEQLPYLLSHLLYWQRRGCEVLLVDGGSHDSSAETAEALGYSVLRSACGRAQQMNAGAAQAQGKALVFLHADTRLPVDADRQILAALQHKQWGRFDIKLTGDSWMLGVIAFFISLRSRLSGIATGDQALFIAKDTFLSMGGFAEQPLMEDIELCKRLKHRGRPSCLRAKVTSSGRRWMTRGVLPTIWLMWRLRWKYWRGVPVEQLAKEYQ
ncbi:MAG: TIGR04283 family arsenosugar biosynthesis glycosyltransferase [Pseudomonas sp.]|nr:TIGR04283 family arsenosugar biosynthesis glycosyltransferase [Pseudomonas sp.]